jgi:predicted TPR repeat methyltransferase
MTSTSSAALPDRTAKRLQTVRHLIASGKFSEAAERLRGVVKSEPADPRVYLVGMQLAEAVGQPKDAEQAGRRAVQLAPDWPVALTELALLLARQNQFESAIEHAQKAMALDGDNPDVLGRAIGVAHRTKRLDLAKLWLTRAIAMAPDNVEIRRQLAWDLRLTGELEEAVNAYDALLAADPADAVARMGRAQTLLALGQGERAAADTAALLAADPANENYGFWDEVAQGRTPSRQPVAMVRDMYEGMASSYDQHVVAELKYKLPREAARKIRELYPRELNVLDLGSGTGLLGACLGRIDGALIGVEISPRMVEQAARHNVYDRFHTVDLIEALQETPDGLYDVVAALDVLIYVGDITGAVPNAFRVLRPGGHFIFSCETALPTEADLVLRPTQRYAHKASHVEALCRAAGFEPVTLEPMQLRYENLEPVQGFLVTAKKPA